MEKMSYFFALMIKSTTETINMIVPAKLKIFIFCKCHYSLNSLDFSLK